MEKKEPLALLMGMWTGAATMEDSIKILKKLGLKLSYIQEIPGISGHIPQESRSEKNTCLLQQLLLYLGHVSSLDVHWQKNG